MYLSFFFFFLIGIAFLGMKYFRLNEYFLHVFKRNLRQSYIRIEKKVKDKKKEEKVR